MIIPFLRHHINRTLTNCIRNCHVKGVWSIMLHDEPGNRVRLFFADWSHMLWHNTNPEKHLFSVAIHSHHCAVRLVPVFGAVFNVAAEPPTLAGDHFIEFEYQSAITKGEGRLVPTGNTRLFATTRKVLPAHGLFLDAGDLHTVYVKRGDEAAWLVFEGEEDPEYKPLCYTNNPVFDTRDLYVKESPDAARDLLAHLLAMVGE